LPCIGQPWVIRNNLFIRTVARSLCVQERHILLARCTHSRLVFGANCVIYSSHQTSERPLNEDCKPHQINYDLFIHLLFPLGGAIHYKINNYHMIWNLDVHLSFSKYLWHQRRWQTPDHVPVLMIGETCMEEESAAVYRVCWTFHFWITSFSNSDEGPGGSMS
jgi:hypothetical protein